MHGGKEVKKSLIRGSEVNKARELLLEGLCHVSRRACGCLWHDARHQ
jgi:hypothetical protein